MDINNEKLEVLDLMESNLEIRNKLIKSTKKETGIFSIFVRKKKTK